MVTIAMTVFVCFFVLFFCYARARALAHDEQVKKREKKAKKVKKALGLL